jgi:hypothetical protein
MRRGSSRHDRAEQLFRLREIRIRRPNQPQKAGGLLHLARLQVSVSQRVAGRQATIEPQAVFEGFEGRAPIVQE